MAGRGGALRRIATSIDRWDVRCSARLAARSFPPLVDRGLPLLTRAADHSALWMGVSVLLGASESSSARRAAVRGLASVAITSLLTNQLAKRLLPRRRPDLSLLPAARIARRIPVSSSFPSGHSASAAAFAVGAAVEAPALAVPLGVLAVGVGVSRVYTGMHFPSDVLVGAAIGAGIAGLGATVFRASGGEPVRDGGEPARPQPARPTGRGLVAVVNPESGNGDGATVIDELRCRLPDAEVVELSAGDDLAGALRAAADRGEVLGVAGGDGTVNAAAEAAMAADVPLLVLPAGTFNHCAKDLRLPELGDAVDALAAGRAMRIDVGEAGGRPFVNTASLGSYPQFVSEREKREKRWGKPLAAAIAALAVLRRCPPLPVTVDGVDRALQALFVGNGLYRPAGMVPRWRPRMDTGVLDVRLMDASKPSSPLGLLAAALSGGAVHSSRFVRMRVPDLVVTIRPGGRTNDALARDGEVGDAPRQVRFTVRRQALTVYCGPGGGRPGRDDRPRRVTDASESPGGRER